MNRQALRNEFPFHNNQPLISQGYSAKREANNRFNQVMSGILIYGTGASAAVAIVLGIAHSIIRAFAA